MKNTELYTSRELSQEIKEAGCEPKGEYYWANTGHNQWTLLTYKEVDPKFKHYPAYSYYSLLVTHAIEFWGEKEALTNNDNGHGERICLHCGIANHIQPPRESGCNHVHYPEGCSVCRAKEEDYSVHTLEFLELLQNGKREDAENYIREHSIIFKNTTK